MEINDKAIINQILTVRKDIEKVWNKTADVFVRRDLSYPLGKLDMLIALMEESNKSE